MYRPSVLKAALLITLIFVIPPLLVGMGAPVGLVYIVPFALCVVITVRSLDGSKRRSSDQLATEFGAWLSRQIMRIFGIKPREKIPTIQDRIIASVVATAAASGLMAVVYLTQSNPRWYGTLVAAWLVSMVVAWVVGRPNLQRPNDME